MDIRLYVSVSIAVAVVAGEILSVIFYSHWGDGRYWITALVSDVGLAFLLQFICRKYWVIRRYDDAAWLALWLSVLYFCLEAPHSVYSHRSLARFFWHAVHKFALMFVMTLCLYHFKNY